MRDVNIKLKKSAVNYMKAKVPNFNFTLQWVNRSDTKINIKQIKMLVQYRKIQLLVYSFYQKLLISILEVDKVLYSSGTFLYWNNLEPV